MKKPRSKPLSGAKSAAKKMLTAKINKAKAVAKDKDIKEGRSRSQIGSKYRGHRGLTRQIGGKRGI